MSRARCQGRAACTRGASLAEARPHPPAVGSAQLCKNAKDRWREFDPMPSGSRRVERSEFGGHPPGRLISSAWRIKWSNTTCTSRGYGGGGGGGGGAGKGGGRTGKDIGAGKGAGAGNGIGGLVGA